MRARLAPIILVFVAAAAAAPLFLNSGFLNTRGGGDSPFLLFRLHQLYSALSQGVFPVRWMPDAAFGLGYPFFNYYAALPFYVAAIFKALGASYVLALKLTHLSGFIVAAVAMYGWMRSAGAVRLAAWLAAAAYTFAPFHLVNIYVRGDSLGEFWAFAIFPLCLWAAHRLADEPSIKRGLPLALSYAALILTHNISAFIFSPFLGLYILFLAISRQPSAVSRQRAPRITHHALFIVHCSFFILLALSLSAFFWLPALRETGFGQLGPQITGYFHYANHFRGRDLIQLSPVFNFDVGSANSTPFAMGLAQTALVAVGLIAIFFRFLKTLFTNTQYPIPDTHSSLFIIHHSSFAIRHSSFVILAFILSTFMITRSSDPLWANLPLLPFVQFPWRFLSVQSVFASAMIGLIVQPSGHDERIPNSQHSIPALFRAALLVLGIGYCVLSIIGLRPDFIPIVDADVTAERLQLYEYFTGNIGTTIRYEYLPRWTQPRPYSSEEFLRGAVSLKVLSGDADGERESKHAASQTWIVKVNSASASVAVPLLYWPGWEAREDGQPLDVRPAEGLGWIAFDLPKGQHTVELKLGDTPTRRAAMLVSLFALVIAAVLSRPWRNTRKLFASFAPLRFVLPGLAAILTLALIGRWLNAQAQPNGAATMDFEQQGYLSSAEVRFENGDSLLNYNYSAETIKAGDLLGVSLLWQASGRADFELALVSPAEHLLNLPGTIAETRGRAEDAVGVILRVPEDTTPGVYLLRLELIEAGINAPALTSSGQPRGAIFLRPIRIADTIRSHDTDGYPLTPAVNLLDATAAQTHAADVTITLRWQAAAPVPANYMLALRLRDPSGAELAALDIQPTGGIYPASQWRVGETVPDHYQFDLPLGLPPGDYPLTLTLYDAATLAPAGTATVPIHLSRWSPPPGTGPLFRFTGTLALHDVNLPAQINAGDQLEFTARWTSLAALSQDLSARWSVISPNGEVIAFADQPLASVPSSQWAAGALVVGRPVVSIPITAKPGEYTVSAQLLAPDGSLLSASVDVGRLFVAESDRTTTLPPMRFESGARFGPITLAGYDVAIEGQKLLLTLVWQASAAPAKDYKYFVHVFNPADETIAAQSDSFPSISTSQWFEKEVMKITVSLPLTDLQSGTLYNIGVGWYDPASGERLGERVILNEGVMIP